MAIWRNAVIPNPSFETLDPPKRLHVCCPRCHAGIRVSFDHRCWCNQPLAIEAPDAERSVDPPSVEDCGEEQ
jgi:hypothetical protein